MANQQVSIVATEVNILVDGDSGAIPIEQTDWRKEVGPRAQTELVLFLDVTASAGTTPTIDISVEWSMDGVKFAIPVVAQAFEQEAEADLAQVLVVPVLGTYYRLVYDLEGTSPDYTFTIRELVR